MTQIIWDAVSERSFETGVDRGVLYPVNAGLYDNGYGWNGLTKVTEKPSGATATPFYADNGKYLNLVSAEDFGGTLEAFTYPKEFAQCDGTASPQVGVSVGQQGRRSFGLSYRTKLGNDILGSDYSYKLHLVYGALAAPSERAYETINDSPNALAFSWDFSTTGVAITGLKPSALLTLDTSKLTPANVLALENALYGTAGTSPRLPLPDEVIAMFAGAITLVTPVAPTFTVGTGVIVIPTVVGVAYRRGDTNALVANGASITIPAGSSIIIKAVPASGSFAFTANSDDAYSFVRP